MINEITTDVFALTTIFLFYTDPGSGALILQIIMAALFGTAFYFRKIAYKLFGKKMPDKIESTENNLTEIIPAHNLKIKK